MDSDRFDSRSELPTYDQGPDSSGDNPDQRDNNQGGGENERARRDVRANYALVLQKACNSALSQVKHSGVIANNEWAKPLATAPSAVSIMAILLKAADREAAAGLEIESQEIRSDGELKGTLPSKYFHTNLQHCSDLGRMAFLDAQVRMNAIQATARSLISEEGSIPYIIDLLEDPEDAKYNLKPEIDALKKTAKSCLDSARAITEKFKYWYLVINQLKLSSLSKSGEIVKEKNETRVKGSNAAMEKEQSETQKRALQERIAIVKNQLSAAENEVERAQVEVDRLRSAPIFEEPSALDEMAKVQRLVPHEPLPRKDRGWLINVRDAVLGKSVEHETEDAAEDAIHTKNVERRRQEALESARQQRNLQRQMAADRLRNAQDREDEIQLSLNSAFDELKESTHDLAEAKAKLSKAKGEMKLLSNREVELGNILNILENSSQRLGELKDTVEPLVLFFSNVLGDIDQNVKQNLQSFLLPIENRIAESTTSPDEIEAIHISHRSKKKLMASALQMQGRFSAIADISKAYVQVSIDYIRPAIQRMERLSTVPDAEWDGQSQAFIHWCDSAMMDIHSLTSQASVDIDNNLTQYMDNLKRRAIEAAAERTE